VGTRGQERLLEDEEKCPYLVLVPSKDGAVRLPVPVVNAEEKYIGEMIKIFSLSPSLSPCLPPSLPLFLPAGTLTQKLVVIKSHILSEKLLCYRQSACFEHIVLERRVVFTGQHRVDQAPVLKGDAELQEGRKGGREGGEEI